MNPLAIVKYKSRALARPRRKNPQFGSQAAELSPTNKIALYRQCSDDCLTLSERAGSRSDRVWLVKRAEGWRELAESLEKRLGEGDPVHHWRWIPRGAGRQH